MQPFPQNKNQAPVFETDAWFDYSLFFELLEHIHEFFRYRHADFAEVFQDAYALIGYEKADDECPGRAFRSQHSVQNMGHSHHDEEAQLFEYSLKAYFGRQRL